MQFEGARRSAQAPNLTPLIDIVFLLLIFFMLTAHFVRDEGLPIELPEAVSAVSLEQKEPLEIAISSSGQVTISGERVVSELLVETVSSLLSSRDEKRIVIRGDAGASLGDSVKVLDAARRAGASGVDIVTEQPSQ
jgi:biopolymer transport protein ExbD